MTLYIKGSPHHPTLTTIYILMDQGRYSHNLYITYWIIKEIYFLIRFVLVQSSRKIPCDRHSFSLKLCISPNFEMGSFFGLLLIIVNAFEYKELST